MQARAAEQIKAKSYERTEEKEDYRNGYYERKLETRVDSITLRVTRFRYGKFTTVLFQRYQRSEQALLLALMGMVVNGVATREVEEITYGLCGTEFSKSTLSYVKTLILLLHHGSQGRLIKKISLCYS